VAAGEDPVPRIELPLTIEKLWYRTGGKRRQGYLTVGEEGLEFTTKKKTFLIPLERVHHISYGTIKSDVDTEWAVLTVGATEPYVMVGFRDGKKWGYGNRTREVFERLRGVMRQLSAAQYRVPDGHQTYEDPDHGCMLAFPDSWHAYVESLVLVGSRSSLGLTVLSEAPIRTVEKSANGPARNTDDLELLDAVLAGESPGFFVERTEVKRGMSCNGFSSGARTRLLRWAAEDLIFDADHEMLEAPSATQETVGGCGALRLIGRSRRRSDGNDVVLEIFAVARGDTLYLFGLRALADRYEEHRKVFAAAVDSVRFPVLEPR
jgi:hypothetical protein